MPPAAASPTAVDDIIITDELARRPSRTPDYEAEAKALAALGRQLAEGCDDVLQNLVDIIVELGIAGSAGVSLREDDRFRWIAIAGAWSHHSGEGIEFDASPCGVIVSRNQMLLFAHPEKIFPIRHIEPAVEEILLVPFHATGQAVGTLWIMVHDGGRKIDREDARLLQSLASFASTAYQMMEARQAAKAAGAVTNTKYRALFDSIDQGFCILEVLFDADGQPTDYMFLEVNRAFESQTGLVDAAGKRMRAMRPDHEDFWFETYGRIARTGRPEHFEHEAKALDRWFEVYAFSIGEPEHRHVAVLFNDVTARTHAEDALRQSEARFRALVTAGSYSTYRMSPDWRELYELVGQHFLADAHGPVRNWLEIYILDEDRPMIRAAINEAIRNTSVFELEHRVRRADGSIGWTLSRAVPIVGGNGEIVEWFGTARDVTARRRAAERLRDSEQRLSLILESARDYAIFTTTADDIIDNWPPGAEAVFGWTREEAEGRHGSLLFTPEDRARGVPQLEIETARSKGKAPNYRWHVHKDGHRVFIEGQVVPLRASSGEIRGFLKIGRDATERRTAEEALRTSEERFRKFGEASSDLLWIRDAETLIFEYLSPAFERLYGVPREQVLAANNVDAWLKLIHPDDRGVAVDVLRQLRDGIPSNHEFRVVWPDGRVRWIHNTDFPLRDEQGRVERIAGIAQDVTDRKRAVELQGTLLAELQHRVRNILAMIRSVVRRTAENKEEVEEFEQHLEARIDALARTQATLTRSFGAGVDVKDLVLQELAAHAPQWELLTIRGPDLRLAAKAAEVLTLAIHELATNSIKYGALAMAQGRIKVSWSCSREGDQPWLHLRWQEHGIDVPAPPHQEGFGTELITRRVPYELGGRGEMNFSDGALVATIEFPLQEQESVLQTDAINLMERTP